MSWSEKNGSERKISKIRFEVKEIPELIWQRFGFCESDYFKNQIIYLARNINPTKVYCISGPSGSGKGELVKLIAEFVGNREKDIKEMMVAKFYDEIILGKKLERSDVKKILNTIKDESEKYVFVYHTELLHKLKEFWKSEYEFLCGELTGKIFRTRKDFWRWEANTLEPKIENYFSSRSRAKFKHINVAQIPRELIESELFGHKKGAFTGAYADKDGILSGNTDDTVIFIDEVSKAPVDLQNKLLTAIEERKFRKIGDTKDEELRGIIFFTINKSPRELIEEGRILEDFWHRISSNLIIMPSLKEHIEHGDRFEEIMEFIISAIHTERKLGERTFFCPLPDCEFREFEVEVMGGKYDCDVPVDIKLISHIEKIYGRENGNFILRELEKFAVNGALHGNIRQLFNIAKFIIEDKKPIYMIERLFERIKWGILSLSDRNADKNGKQSEANADQDVNQDGDEYNYSSRNSVISAVLQEALREDNFSKAKLMLSALLWYLKSQNGESIKISKGTKAKYKKVLKEILEDKHRNSKELPEFSKV